jgi:hypothetical protein
VAILWHALGALIIAVGLVDVFLNVLAYDAAGLPVERSYRVIWRVIRAITRHLPDNPAGFFRALGAPLMVVWTIAGWLAIQVLGFALVYYPGATDGSLSHPGLPSTFWTPLYFSSATITSLSLNGAQPRGLPMHFAAAAETLIGLGILTLGITFVLGLYQVVQDEGAVWTNLQHRALPETDPRSLLVPHFHDGVVDDLSPLWRDFHHNLTSYLEGMRRYPVVYYFHVRQQYRSLPYMFWFIGEAASAVRWGLPSGHRAAVDPWLPGLLEGYRRAMQDIQDRFITVPVAAQLPPADRVRFAADRVTGRSGVDSVADFLELERYMAVLASVRTSPDNAEAYERYQQWWTLTAARRAFVRAASADFGMDPTGESSWPA